MRVRSLCCVALASLSVLCESLPVYYGLYALTNTDPASLGALIPNLSSSFQKFIVKARFFSFDAATATGVVFGWTNNVDSTLWLAMYPSYDPTTPDYFMIGYHRAGVVYNSANYYPTAAEKLSLNTFEVGFDTNGNLYLKVNGVEKLSSPAPPPVDGVSHWKIVDWGVDGIVTDLSIHEQGDTYMDRIHTRNIPGQLYRQKPFGLYVYAQFSNVGGYTGQTLFDFSKGADSDRISLWQNGTSSDMVFEVYQGGVAYNVVANNAIVENQWALWEAGINSNGVMWLTKGDTVYQSNHGIFPNGGFRQNTLFGSTLSTLASHDDLRGNVLGFRLDPGDGS